METFDELIAAARAVASYQAIADACGVKRASVQSWERSGSVPMARTARLRQFLRDHGIEVTAEEVEAMAARREGVG